MLDRTAEGGCPHVLLCDAMTGAIPAPTSLAHRVGLT